MQAGRRTIKAVAPSGTKETAYRTWPIRYSGAGMRHVKLREPKDADRPAVKRLIRQAFRRGGMDMRGRTT
jgi:hypothetical protein